MNLYQFVKEKKDEILALAARHGAGQVRLVKPTAQDEETDVVRLVATFSDASKRTNYFDCLVEFQEDLEVWLGVTVHVYDANGFKGADGQAFLNETVSL